MKYSNPIIPGFYPDPSICKYKDTYYMVHSTFQYFPGVTLFESKDLLNWTQIGNVLTRDSQLPLVDARRSEGIFAPTIRCNEGRFYMVTTNVTTMGNFYVWTDDIHGEWSEPIIVDQGGIDPSLYFEDGICYFMSNGTDEHGKSGIMQCEIDVITGKKLTEGKFIWNGTGGRFLESPHLFKINGQYYITAAEGGTEYGHFVVCAKGNSPYGPFVSAPHNPVLTNRNLGGYQIQGCGHGDLIEDYHGNWWMMHLGYRQIGQWSMYHITGRETYMVPVTFDEEGWPHFGHNGTTLLEIETDRLPEDLAQVKRTNYTFENTKVGVEWVYLRNPHRENYNCSKEAFVLTPTTVNINDDLGSPTFIAIRQCEMTGSVSCEVSVEEGEAGLTLYMDNLHHYDLMIKKTEEGAELWKRIRVGDIDFVQKKIVLSQAEIATAELRVRFTLTNYIFEAIVDGVVYELGQNHTKYLSKEVAEGFTGVMIGLFAQGEDSCKKAAVFKNFQCDFSEK